MWRIEVFFEWQGQWWLQQVNHDSSLTDEHREGLNAYALCQAQLRITMRDRCKHLGHDIP
ncbi:hypothetical protein IEO21_11129 [Rhodonia placenta]|uniref:Uncharacterized protein n=1 Tax=Rhodonia placenta TaxID=104341 RepID=A0A8H7NRD1_9APHY|nr:hypothetical protein IEO21_11129 [Postia placenta]